MICLFNFKRAYLFVTLNPVHSNIETQVLQYLHKNLSPQFSDKNECNLFNYINQQLKGCILKGKSVLNNIPYPDVISIGGHSYVLFAKIIQDFLANNTPYYNFFKCKKEFDANNFKHISQC